MQLEGRTALVTGGGRGIGREIARLLAAKGVTTIVVGRDSAHLDSAREAFGDRIVPMPADLSDRAAVERLLQDLRRDHPRLSLLINNAGIQVEFDFVELESAGYLGRFRDEVAVNLEALVMLSNGLLPSLAGRKSAAIVNITSILGFAPKRSAPVYCATKAGVHVFSQALRYQCEDRCPNVAVMEAVMPLVETDMTAGRGSGKITASAAAEALVAGIEADRKELWIGKAGLIRVLNGVAPRLVRKMLRNS